MRNNSIPSQANNLNDSASINPNKTPANAAADNRAPAQQASAASQHTISGNHIEALEKRRDLILTHREALAGCPDDIAVCGEEDIGSGLEFLVMQDNQNK